MGWTTDLLGGLATRLATLDGVEWHPDGTPYDPGDVAIILRGIPQQPDKLITLAAYPRDDNRHRGMADHDTAVQIRVRGDQDSRTCDDLADAIFTELDSLAGVTLGGVPLVQMWRQSYTSLGQDANGRWERSENYYVEAMRPTQHKTD